MTSKIDRDFAMKLRFMSRRHCRFLPAPLLSLGLLCILPVLAYAGTPPSAPVTPPLDATAQLTSVQNLIKEDNAKLTAAERTRAAAQQVLAATDALISPGEPDASNPIVGHQSLQRLQIAVATIPDNALKTFHAQIAVLSGSDTAGATDTQPESVAFAINDLNTAITAQAMTDALANQNKSPKTQPERALVAAQETLTNLKTKMMAERDSLTTTQPKLPALTDDALTSKLTATIAFAQKFSDALAQKLANQQAKMLDASSVIEKNTALANGKAAGADPDKVDKEQSAEKIGKLVTESVPVLREVLQLRAQLNALVPSLQTKLNDPAYAPKFIDLTASQQKTTFALAVMTGTLNNYVGYVQTQAKADQTNAEEFLTRNLGQATGRAGNGRLPGLPSGPCSAGRRHHPELARAQSVSSKHRCLGRFPQPAREGYRPHFQRLSNKPERT